MRPYRYEQSAAIRAPAAVLFARLDDPRRMLRHMSRSSWRMAGCKVYVDTDAMQGQAVGSRILLTGRVLGRCLSAAEMVIEYAPPRRKVWATIGDVRLLVIGAYRMGFNVRPDGDGSLLSVFIEYTLPTHGAGRCLGLLFGRIYARWCVRQMISDAAATDDCGSWPQTPVSVASVEEGACVSS